MSDHRVVRVAREEQNFALGVDQMDFLSQFTPPQMRHHDIGDEQIDGISVSLHEFQRFFPIGCLVDCIAVVFEDLSGQRSDGLFIFCDQYRFCAARNRL